MSSTLEPYLIISNYSSESPSGPDLISTSWHKIPHMIVVCGSASPWFLLTELPPVLLTGKGNCGQEQAPRPTESVAIYAINSISY